MILALMASACCPNSNSSAIVSRSFCCCSTGYSRLPRNVCTRHVNRAVWVPHRIAMAPHWLVQPMYP
jgi:hypothetical protein